MRKIATSTLAMVMLLSLTACGGGESTVQPPANAAAQNQASSAVQTTAETIEEMVLVDEAGVKITAKNLDKKSMFGADLKLLIENDSGKDLTVQSRNASVNGYMVQTMLSSDVADGKKANDALTFMTVDLQACGIETIADMEFSFHIFDSESWDTYLDTPLISVKTSSADTYNYVYDDSGSLAYEGNGVKIIIKGLSSDDSIFGPGVIVYIENTGDKDITVQTRSVSINGFMMDPVFSADVGVGKHAIDSITFMNSELEENEITQINTVELSFYIFDGNTWDTIVETDPITMNF